MTTKANRKQELPRYAPVGAYVHCAYWQENYTVLSHNEAKDWMGESVTIQWDDGRIGTHCTPFTYPRYPGDYRADVILSIGE